MIASTLKQCTEEICRCCDTKLMKALSEPIRVELFAFLVFNGRSDIKTITRHFPIDRSNVSRHLQIMSEVGILDKLKESRHIYYQVNISALEARVEILFHLVQMLKQRQS